MAPIVEEIRVGESTKRFARLRALAPFVFALAALVLGTIPILSWETLSITREEGNDNLVLFAGTFCYKLVDLDPESYKFIDGSGWKNYGLFQGFTRDWGECEQYRYLENGYSAFEFEVDHATRIVWVVSILTPILGILLVVKCVSTVTCPVFDEGYGPCELWLCGLLNKGSWKCMGYSLVATSVLQGLTLVSLASSLCDNNPFIQHLGYYRAKTPNWEPVAELYNAFQNPICEPAKGYFMQIAAVALWALAGAITFWIDEPERFAKNQEQHKVARQKPQEKKQQRKAAAENTHPDYTDLLRTILGSITKLREQIKLSATDDEKATFQQALDIEIANLERVNKQHDDSTRDLVFDVENGEEPLARK